MLPLINWLSYVKGGRSNSSTSVSTGICNFFCSSATQCTSSSQDMSSLSSSTSPLSTPLTNFFAPVHPVLEKNLVQEAETRIHSKLDFITTPYCLKIPLLIIALHLYSTVVNLSLPSLFTLKLLLFLCNVIFFIAFLSLHMQVEGLIGMDVGILPINGESVNTFIKRQDMCCSIFVKFIFRLIYVFWSFVYRNKRKIHVKNVSFVGIFISCIIFLGFLSSFFYIINPAILPALFFANFVLYLSFRYYGKDFFTFQWDALLLETGILSVFGSMCVSVHLTLSSNICMSAFRLLLFKVTFCSGLCKFASRCPRWSTNTALNYLFWTQPLPNALSWNAYWMKNKNILCIANTIAECIAPFFIFGNRTMRLTAFTIISGLMISIWATGNYGFFNILTIVIAVSLFDDECFPIDTVIAIQTSTFRNFVVSMASFFVLLVVLFYYLVYTLANIVPLCRVWRRKEIQKLNLCEFLYSELSCIHACNIYGLFATITTFRYEVIVEELHRIDNKMQWVEINFKYKPGDVNNAPPNLWWGHMPRLDWRVWFIPLRINKLFKVPSISDYISNKDGNQFGAEDLLPFFFKSFLVHLIKRNPHIINLLGRQKYDLFLLGRPRALRISFYDYRFSPPKNVPPYFALFPNGNPSLSDKDVDFLSKEMTLWEIGSWWMRRNVKMYEFSNVAAENSALNKYE